jgi:hypothetical protein
MQALVHGGHAQREVARGQRGDLGCGHLAPLRPLAVVLLAKVPEGRVAVGVSLGLVACRCVWSVQRPTTDEAQGRGGEVCRVSHTGESDMWLWHHAGAAHAQCPPACYSSSRWAHLSLSVSTRGVSLSLSEPAKEA